MGDCCGKSGKSGQYKYCKSCSCVDPKKTSQPIKGTSCEGTCSSGGVYKGDGYCDDGNNNCGCEYDGGDCCGKSRQASQFKYCKSCACVDPKKTSQPIKGKSCEGTCSSGGVYKGDGYCDDGNNNCGCEYDGGDCCATSKKNGQFK